MPKISNTIEPGEVAVFGDCDQTHRSPSLTVSKITLAAAKARGKKLGSSGKKLAAENAAAAAARDADLEPALRKLSGLSARAAAAEIERRGLGKISYRTVMRARVRLGLED